MADWIHLDAHTKTKPSRPIAEKWAQDQVEHWLVGNGEVIGKRICNLMGAKNGHFSFCSYFSLFYAHYVDFIRQTGRTHILYLENEREEIVNEIKKLEKFEVRGKALPVNENGHLTKQGLEEALRARSSLLSLSWAHPKTGVIQPIHDLIAVCKEKGVKIHLDVGPAIGKLHFDVDDFDVDFLTFEGKLIHCPGNSLGLIAKERISDEPISFADSCALESALKGAREALDTYAMEVGRLQTLLEKEAGGTMIYSQSERLPNTVALTFEGIHGEYLRHHLQKQGLFVAAGSGLPFDGISMALSLDTKEEEILRASVILKKSVEKLGKKPLLFSEEDARAKNMRLCTVTHGAKSEGKKIDLSLLVDEEDGVIADAKFSAFGPPKLVEAAEVLCSLLIRKNYLQARRLTADLLEKEVGECPASDLNFLIDAVDGATASCMDIPIEDIYMAPPEMGEGERTVYPNWEDLSDTQKKGVIAQVMERDIQPYVELDAGGVEVIKVEENRVTIAYSGNCTSCYSATGATLDAIGSILRHKIYPDLMVVPDLSLLQYGEGSNV